jgi:hypothetical protein
VAFCDPLFHIEWLLGTAAASSFRTNPASVTAAAAAAEVVAAAAAVAVALCCSALLLSQRIFRFGWQCRQDPSRHAAVV